MTGKTFGKAALASLLVATAMVGWNGSGFKPTAVAGEEHADARKFATGADKALAHRDGRRAVEAAEAAVRMDPQNAAYRQLLGRSYVAAGRFASAQSAFSDAMTLGNSDARTIVSLALVQVAQGRPEAARALLAQHADTVPATDYGLAMAMAGDADEGVRILSQAIHDPSATARTRQNLAYAYALSGRWKDARMVADLDMGPLDAAKRISDWAQLAAPMLAPQRVAALMGVGIDGSDAGLPSGLALAPATPSQPIEMAAAPEVAPVTPSAPEPQPVETAQVDATLPSMVQPTQSLSAPIREAAAFRVSAPARIAKREPLVDRQTFAARPSPMARFQKAAFIRPVSDGASSWVVQLGAYDSAAIAEEKWAAMAGRSSTLAAFPVLTSQISVGGRNFHRLAISGFADRDAAAGACRAIKARGGQCFVRETTPNAVPLRWAFNAKGRQFAGR